MRNAPYTKSILTVVILFNALLTFAQEQEPPPPVLKEDVLAGPPPPGLPIENGLVILLMAGLVFAFYYYKNIYNKKASN